MESFPDRYVITIGRRMGSGGRALGRMLAERLGIDFYDRNLLVEAAKRAGMSPEVFERNDERRPQFMKGLFFAERGFGAVPAYAASSISEDATYNALSTLMHEIAASKPCVIVGRTADYVLRDVPNLVNVFVHADTDDCARRIMKRDPGLSFEQAKKLSEKTNKLRAGFYNFYTDKRWGDSGSYDLTFNSSTTPLSDIADLIIEFMKLRFKNTPNQSDKQQ